jgi:putative hemolysin
MHKGGISVKDRHQDLILLLLFTLSIALISAGCVQSGRGSASSVTTPTPDMPDPAGAFCLNMNNRLDMRKNPDGSEYGLCILPDSTECDAWDYYRGLCPAVTTTEGISSHETPGNPSGILCRAKNYSYAVRSNPDGSEYGVCIFPGGKECEAWAYYLGECNATTAGNPDLQAPQGS